MRTSFLLAVTIEIGDIDPAEVTEDLELAIAQGVERGCSWADEVTGVEFVDAFDPPLDLARTIETVEVRGGAL